jgi:hypothetical protein
MIPGHKLDSHPRVLAGWKSRKGVPLPSSVQVRSLASRLEPPFALGPSQAAAQPHADARGPFQAHAGALSNPF